MNGSLHEIAEVLSNTPDALKSLMEKLPERLVYATEGETTWSPFDVLGHLIHGEKTDWIPRAKIILEFGESRAFDSFDRFAMFEESKGKTIPVLLQEFAALRAENIATLKSLELDKTDLEKTGTHPALGRVTLGQLLATWVVHDLDHLSQIIRVCARLYRNEVGLWKAYLKVLG